jgi:hypothetical protein
MATTIEQARADVHGYRESRRGLMGASDVEWLAGYTGPLMSGRPIYGTLTEPVNGEPVIARFTDGRKWSDLMVVQQIAPDVYMNCVCGTVFEWSDDHVVIYSALSRQGESWRIFLEERRW